MVRMKNKTNVKKQSHRGAHFQIPEKEHQRGQEVEEVLQVDPDVNGYVLFQREIEPDSPLIEALFQISNKKNGSKHLEKSLERQETREEGLKQIDCLLQQLILMKKKRSI